MIAVAQITISDLYDPIQQGTAPPFPVVDMLWLDTSVSPNLLKRWNGTEWIIVNDNSDLRDEIDNVRETVVTVNADLSVAKGNITALTERITTTESDIDGLSVDVEEAKATLTPEGLNVIVEQCQVVRDIDGDINDVSQEVAQVAVTANKIYWLIDGNSSSSAIVLTEHAAEVISKSIKLTAEQINVIAKDLDLDGNPSINLMVSSSEERVLARTNVHRGETPPLDACINNLWVQPSTGYTYQLVADNNIHPSYYLDENGVLYYTYSDDQQEYELYMDDSGNFYISADASLAVAISQDGTPSTWIRVKDSELADAAQSALTAAQAAQAKANQNAADMAATITEFESEFSSLQSQIDGNIASWFEYGVPTNYNTPASQWTTTALKNAHLGDLYYDRNTGYCYRWQLSGSVYSWTRIADTDVTKALSDAASAKDTADSKRRVFVATPTPPYDVGDLWVQGSGGDIMRCQYARTAGSYYASDWVLASKYTDDTKANDVEEQIDAIHSELTLRQDNIEAAIVKKVDGEELRTYLRFDDEGVKIGRTNSRYTTLTSDNGFFVLQDGAEMTSIVQNTVRAPVIEANRMFSIGDFALRLGANGHLILA